MNRTLISPRYTEIDRRYASSIIIAENRIDVKIRISHGIGVRGDLGEKLRFLIEENRFISKKQTRRWRLPHQPVSVMPSPLGSTIDPRNGTDWSNTILACQDD